jgi:hypothetical protein
MIILEMKDDDNDLGGPTRLGNCGSDTQNTRIEQAGQDIGGFRNDFISLSCS